MSVDNKQETAFQKKLVEVLLRLEVDQAGSFVTSAILANAMRASYPEDFPPSPQDQASLSDAVVVAKADSLPDRITAALMSKEMAGNRLVEVSAATLEAGQATMAFRLRNGHTTDQLKQIYDYSKFHIGLYSAIIAGLMTLLTWGGGTPPPSGEMVYTAKWAVGLLIIAGMAGGIIATSILDVSNHYGFWTNARETVDVQTNLGEFAKTRLLGPRVGPWHRSWLRLSEWALIEHSAFWLAVFAISIIVLLRFGLIG